MIGEYWEYHYKNFTKVCLLVNHVIPSNLAATINIEEFSRKCKLYHKNNWPRKNVTYSKLELYTQLRDDFTTAEYILKNLDKKYRLLICMLLSGNLKLNLEVGRYKVLPRAHCICQICNDSERRLVPFYIHMSSV